MSHREYWTKLRGEDYNAMFAGKYDDVHEVQERWLLDNVKHDYLVLDVGCGPGRLARLLSARCDYHGYDQSPEMTKPLRDAIDRGDVDADVRAWISPRYVYQAAFTCSVLIHNPFDEAKELVAKMCEVAERVWLIENKRHVGPSEMQSAEHGGCWVHDYDLMVPDKWSIKIESLCRTHDVYCLSKT